MENNKELQRPQLPDQSFEDSPFVDVKRTKFRRKKVQSKLTYMKKSVQKEKLCGLEENFSVAGPSKSEVPSNSEDPEFGGVNNNNSVSDLETCDDACQRKKLECPVCLKTFDNKGVSITHLNKCASKNNLTIKQILDALDLQEKHKNERKAIGLPCNPVGPKKGNSRKITSGKDQDLQLALALSASMQEAEEKELLREQEIYETDASPDVTATHMALLEKFGFTSSRPAVASNLKMKQGGRLRLPLLGDLPLLARSSEERERLITEKVAIVLMGAETAETAAEAAAASSVPLCAAPLQSPLLLRCEDKECRLWRLTALASAGAQQFYVCALSSAVSEPRPTTMPAPTPAEELGGPSSPKGAGPSVVCSTGPAASCPAIPSAGIPASPAASFVVSLSPSPAESPTASATVRLDANLSDSPAARLVPNFSSSATANLSASSTARLAANLSASPAASLASSFGASFTARIAASCTASLGANPSAGRPQFSPTSQRLSRDWRKLLNRETMSDVTVCVKGNRTIPAHSLVLYVRCPAILRDLKEVYIAGKITKYVTWSSMTYRSALAFLEFIYCGTYCKALNLREGLDSVKYLANRYEVPDLSDNLENIENVRKKLKALHASQNSTDNEFTPTDIKISGLEMHSQLCTGVSKHEPKNGKVQNADKECEALHCNERSPSPDPFGDIVEASKPAGSSLQSKRKAGPAEQTPGTVPSRWYRKRKSCVRVSLAQRFVQEKPENGESVAATYILPGLQQYMDSSKQTNSGISTPLCEHDNELKDTSGRTSLLCIKIISSDSEDEEAKGLLKKPRSGQRSGSVPRCASPSPSPSPGPGASRQSLASVKRLLEDSFLDGVAASAIWPDSMDMQRGVATATFSPKDYQLPLGNSETPQQSTRVGSEITPMPNYSAMKTPTLKKELQRYGLKALKRKQAKLILRHIYDKLHPWVVASARKAESQHTATGAPGTPCSRRSPLKASNPGVIVEATANVHTSSGDAEDVHGAVHVAVQRLLAANTHLHECVLLYQPLWLDQLYADLSPALSQHKLKLEQLIEYLDEQGITFRTEQKGSRTLPQRKKEPRGLTQFTSQVGVGE